MYFSLYLNRNIPIDDVCDEQVHDTHTTHYVYEYWTTKKKRNNKNYVLLYGAAAAVYLLSFCACSNSNVSVSLRLSS